MLKFCLHVEFYGLRRWTSVVGIVTGNGLNVPGFVSRQGQEISSSKSPRPSLRPTQLLIQWFRCAFTRLKRPGREVDYSPPCSAKVEKEQRGAFPAAVCLRGVLLFFCDYKQFIVKHQLAFWCVIYNFCSWGYVLDTFTPSETHKPCHSWRRLAAGFSSRRSGSVPGQSAWDLCWRGDSGTGFSSTASVFACQSFHQWCVLVFIR